MLTAIFHMYVQLRSGSWITFERIRVYSWMVLDMNLATIVVIWIYPLGMLDLMVASERDGFF